MYTDIIFRNMSLNVHKPDVTIFQDFKLEDITAWKVIKSCNYLWYHPFRVNWGYSYRFFDSYGNYSQTVPIEKREQRSYDICIEFDISNNTIAFTKEVNGKYIGVQLLKNDLQIAKSLFIDGTLHFELSNNFFICADVHALESGKINKANRNKSECQFDTTGFKKMEVLMLGGEAGKYSTPIKFVPSKCIKWKQGE